MKWKNDRANEFVSIPTPDDMFHASCKMTLTNATHTYVELAWPSVSWANIFRHKDECVCESRIVILSIRFAWTTFGWDCHIAGALKRVRDRNNRYFLLRLLSVRRGCGRPEWTRTYRNANTNHMSLTSGMALHTLHTCCIQLAVQRSFHQITWRAQRKYFPLMLSMPTRRSSAL